MTIFTIIVTYNGCKWTDFCLGSLRKSTIKTIPLVIDNCSTDGTLDYIREHYPEAVLFPQEKNLGFGQANNIGIRYALDHGADYCLLLNQDAAISADAIELMLAQSDGESLVSPIHMNGDGTRLDNNFRDASLSRCKPLLNDAFAGTLKPVYECGEVCAACWLLPRKVIEKIGGFNPLFFHYSEDNNYYQRLVYHHIKVLLVPQAHMYHDRVGLYGNKRVWNQQWLHNIITLTCTNINLTAEQCMNDMLHALWTCYTYRLPQKQYQVGAFFMAICRLIRYGKQIKNSRTKEKRIQSNWL